MCRSFKVSDKSGRSFYSTNATQAARDLKRVNYSERRIQVRNCANSEYSDYDESALYAESFSDKRGRQ